MAILTNNEEVAFGAGIFTLSIMATAIASQTWLPESFRVTAAGVLYLIALAAGTFWAVYVKAAGNPANVPLPSQVAVQRFHLLCLRLSRRQVMLKQRLNLSRAPQNWLDSAHLWGTTRIQKQEQKMGYCTTDNVKNVLQIDIAETKHDAQIEDSIAQCRLFD